MAVTPVAPPSEESVVAAQSPGFAAWLQKGGKDLKWFNALATHDRTVIVGQWHQTPTAPPKGYLVKYVAATATQDASARVESNPRLEAPSSYGVSTTTDSTAQLPGVPSWAMQTLLQSGMSLDQIAQINSSVPQVTKSSGLTPDAYWQQVVSSQTRGYVSQVYNVPAALQNASILVSRINNLKGEMPGKERQMMYPERGANTYQSFLNVISQPNTEHWQSDKVSQLQARLVAAGSQYLQQGGYSNGVYDDATIRAYGNILEIANREGKTPDEVLNDLAKANASSKKNFQFQKPAFVKADEGQLKETLRQDLNQQFGRDPTKAELNAAISTYRNYEQKNYSQYEVPAAQYQQQSAYNKSQNLAQPATPTLTQMSPSDIEAAVTNQNEQSAPAQQYRGAKLGLSLMDLLARG